MQVAIPTAETKRYAKTVEVSKRIRWDIDRDVIKGREFDFTKKFLPDGLSKATSFGFLSPVELRILSQIQGRTYANMFGLVERFIGAKMLEVSRVHWLGDQVALEALVRFTDEELKHQELFRRIEAMIAAGMPAGYQFLFAAERSGDARPRQVDVVGAGAHLHDRAVHAGALPLEHRARSRSLPTVEGRVPAPLEGGIATRDPGRARVEARGRQAYAAKHGTPRSTT